MNLLPLHKRTFMLLLIAATIGFGAVLWEFMGAIFWGVALAILFSPLHRRLLARMPRRTNLAALSTLLLCLVVAILPLALIGASLVREASLIYERVNSGNLDAGTYLQQIMDALPSWVTPWLERLHLGSLAELQDKLSSIAMQASKLAATKALMRRARFTAAADLVDVAAAIFSHAAQGPEGQEGMAAFIQKRKPQWAVT